MKIKRIVPNIETGNVSESRAFYGQFLGLDLAMDMNWIATFQSASNPLAQISILNKNDNTKLASVSLTIEVDDVDAACEIAQELGIKVVYPITNEPWGVRRFHVKDPNGLVVNIMSHAD